MSIAYGFFVFIVYGAFFGAFTVFCYHSWREENKPKQTESSDPVVDSVQKVHERETSEH